MTPSSSSKLFVLASACVLATERAEACGVSASGVASCSLAEHREAARSRFNVGVTGTYTDTALRFDGSLRAAETRAAVLGVVAYLPTASLALDAGAGVGFGGALRLPDGTHRFLPGPAASLGAAWRAVDATAYFVLFTAVASFTTNRTELTGEPRVSYTAFDLRLGGELGLKLANVLYPYVLARAFGGPVFWQYDGKDVTGTDIHHYQLGAGLAVGIGGRVSGFVEGVPLGERAVSGGVSVAL